MSNPNRGQGRAAGRSRPPAQQQSRGPGAGAWGQARGHPQQAPRSQQQAGGGGDARGAWGQQQAASIPPQVYQQRAPAPQGPQASSSAGRTSGRPTNVPGVSQKMESLEITGGGEPAGNLAAGRGAMRGRRPIYSSDILVTKPSNMASKKGVSGQTITLRANYFEMLKTTNWCLYQYRVDVDPQEDDTSIRRRLVYTALRNTTLERAIFDGTVLLSSFRIVPDTMELFVDNPNIPEEKFRITVRLVGEVLSTDYQMIQALNKITRDSLTRLKLQLVGRNYYDAMARIPLNQYNLELWPGYITSIRQREQKLMMNVEITHKFMRKETVIQVMNDCYQQNRANMKNNFMEIIIGCIVLTDYNNRTYKVDDVAWDVTPRSQFQKKDGSMESYIDYYAKRYKIKIRDESQPMLISRAKPRELRSGMAELIFLVPELCRMTGITDRERADFNMMRDLNKHTRLRPDQRVERLQAFSHRIRTTEIVAKHLSDWNMQMAENVVRFQGRILPNEQMHQGDGAKYIVGPEADWTKEMRSKKMIILPSVDFRNWAVLCPNNLMNDAHQFVIALREVARGMSLHLPDPQVIQMRDDNAGTYVSTLDAAVNKYNPAFVLCCANNNKADRYAAIKKKCYVEQALPCQVVLKRSLTNKGLKSIATKVAIQINCKLGGAPWMVSMPITGLMVVGFDVCHDPKNKSKSYGGFVASMNSGCLQYWSTVSAHTNGEELSNHFGLHIVQSVREYQKYNKNALPAMIVIYRDGVGEGQLEHVMQHEVKVIEGLLRPFYGEQPLKIAFIVVTKRINTKLFSEGRGGQVCNPPPGTVVDDVITNPQQWDFYIVSQCVREGTVSPTAYNVLLNTTNLDSDKLQRLSYKLTHMYYNWSGTVRVPAPCQYAHKLAFMVSQYLCREPNVNLKNTLFYL